MQFKKHLTTYKLLILKDDINDAIEYKIDVIRSIGLSIPTLQLSISMVYLYLSLFVSNSCALRAVRRKRVILKRNSYLLVLISRNMANRQCQFLSF